MQTHGRVIVKHLAGMLQIIFDPIKVGVQLCDADQEDTARLLVSPPDEFYLVGFIKQYLLIGSDRMWLDKEGFYINDLLNGRVPGSHMDRVNTIFASWNDKLGKKYFGW